MAHPDDWDQVFSSQGALEAVIEAREEGLTRFIGITGHSWTIAAMHRRALDRFDFDSVLMPLNYLMYANERYRRNFEAVVELCKERNVAVQTIKSIARGPWGTTTKTATPGTNRSKTRPTSIKPFIGSWTAATYSLIPPAIATFCRKCWTLRRASNKPQRRADGRVVGSANHDTHFRDPDLSPTECSYRAPRIKERCSGQNGCRGVHKRLLAAGG